ncbi:MAG TPA: UDP-3-O-acyl-N-acetylglucosamine deacetylase [Phycisphaerales bacterium]
MKQSGFIAGRGLFTGREASVAFGPGAGVAFVVGSRVIPARVANVIAADGPLGGRSTNIQDGGVSAFTIEHALSALAGLNVWDAAVTLRGASDAASVEVPIGDGSALDFVRAIDEGVRSRALADAEADESSRKLRMDGEGAKIKAALNPLPHPSEMGQVRLARPIRVEDPKTGAFIEARPSEVLQYRYELSYPPGAGIGDQAAEWCGGVDEYRREIAPARTFCLEREAVAMRAAGLFAHLTPRDMVVIATDGRAIDNELRFDNEPARHKLLDLIGDLALLGGRLIADVRAVRSGHALTHEFCRRVLAAG